MLDSGTVAGHEWCEVLRCRSNLAGVGYGHRSRVVYTRGATVGLGSITIGGVATRTALKMQRYTGILCMDRVYERCMGTVACISDPLCSMNPQTPTIT